MRLLILVVLAVSAAAAVKHRPHKVNAKDVPGAPPSPWRQLTGYVEVNATAGANLFYWFHGAQTNNTAAPFVLWLTGGPGCSAELAMLFENGPWKVADDMTLSINPYSWNNEYNLLYVDSPAGTGFSYLTNPNDYVVNERQVAQDLYTTLETFFRAYPEYAANDFYVVGESYGGHYVPALAERILHGNRKRQARINLKGIAIGNGMTDPLVQYGAYAPFSLAHGLISQQVSDSMDAQYSLCRDAIAKGSVNISDFCSAIPGMVETVAGNFNVYDVTKPCDGDLCYNMTALTMWLNQPAVMQALGVRTTDWVACNSTVYEKIVPVDWFLEESYTVPSLLDYIAVTIYAGSNDWICNHLGNYRWVSKLQWNGAARFNNAPRLPWIDSQGGQAGYEQSAGSDLRFVWVTDAGHMVPMDQPMRALELLDAVVANKPLASSTPKRQ